MSVEDRTVTIFLGGDVMTGRGIDQILGYPNDPRIDEMFVRDARTYVELAEKANGPIPRPVGDAYIWGDALEELERTAPDVRVINLETSVTRSDEAWPKGINYRMHPANVGCLQVARIDVCVLANNHVLDYSYSGLIETLETLAQADLKTTGAGRTLEEARRPAVVEVAPGVQVIVRGFGTESSGIPPDWGAGRYRPGVAMLSDVPPDRPSMPEARQPGEITVASIHWGSNWGYDIPAEHVELAHRLIDGGVDIVHGHSSHHPRPIEVYRNRLILYGCGDLLNDYEGIRGYEEYRPELALMYFATVDGYGGELAELRMVPMHIRRLRLNRAAPYDVDWLESELSWIGEPFGSRVVQAENGSLLLRWQ